MPSASSLLLPFLNHDVMAYIFNLNTYMLETEYGCSSQMVEPSALHTARHTSQVCRSWRHIILQSSAIWGSIIDVDTLSKASNQWFEEVMKRTSKTGLSIYGRSFRLSALEMLIWLLEENWDRVRQLDVAVKFENAAVGHPAIQSNRFYKIFRAREVPFLEKFRVRVYIYGTRVPDEKDLELFTGSAPSLRCFHSQHFHFNRNALWIPRLLSVTLSGPLRISDALNILVNTPLLESLFIPLTVAYNDDAKTWKQDIQLPNLHILHIQSNIAGALVCLSHITPKFDCALSLGVHEDSPDQLKSDNDDLQRLSKIILGCVQGYSQSCHPQKITMYIGNTGVRFCLHKTWDEEAQFQWYHDQDFDVFVGPKAVSQPFDSAVVDMFLSTLSPATLRKVREFEFTVIHRTWLPTTNVISQIIRSLTSVRDMDLTPWALHGLNLLSDSASLFPHLKEVTIDYQRRVKDSNEILRVFLTRREEVGHPLQTLYKPDNCRPKGAKHWIFLKQFEGLRVISTGEGDDSDYSYEGDSDGDDEDDEDGKDGDEGDDYDVEDNEGDNV